MDSHERSEMLDRASRANLCMLCEYEKYLYDEILLLTFRRK